MTSTPPYPGIRITTNGNQLVAYHTEARLTEGGVFYPITPSTEMGEQYGFQNVSKVVLQNRPNIKVMMLDTQVYSNTGGQNSDSTPMPGGGDMNSLGAASKGKYTEKKNVAEIFTGGHGSPYVAQVSLANVANLYRSLIDGLVYRGTAFYQIFTSCQPEHGVADDVSSVQARSVRDSRCMPEFTFNPQLGEMSQDAFSLKGNPNIKNDWGQVKSKARG